MGVCESLSPRNYIYSRLIHLYTIHIQLLTQRGSVFNERICQTFIDNTFHSFSWQYLLVAMRWIIRASAFLFGRPKPKAKVVGRSRSWLNVGKSQGWLETRAMSCYLHWFHLKSPSFPNLLPKCRRCLNPTTSWMWVSGVKVLNNPHDFSCLVTLEKKKESMQQNAFNGSSSLNDYIDRRSLPSYPTVVAHRTFVVTMTMINMLLSAWSGQSSVKKKSTKTTWLGLGKKNCGLG